MFNSGAITEKTLNYAQQEFNKIAEHTKDKNSSLKLVNYTNIRDIYRVIATLVTEATNNLENNREVPEELGHADKVEIGKLSLKKASILIREKAEKLDKLSENFIKPEDKDKVSPFRRMIDALRDEGQSNFAAQKILTEYAPVLPLYDHLGLYQIETGGGRYGLEKPLDQGYFASDYQTMIKSRLKKTGAVDLERDSVGNGFNRQTEDSLVDLNKEVYAKAGPTTIRTFNAMNHIDDSRGSYKAIKKASKETGVSLKIQGEVAIGISEDPKLYGLDYYEEKALRKLDAGAHVIGVKDYSGVQEGWSMESDAVSAHALVKRVKSKVPFVEFTYHNHNTAGRGVDSSVAAILAGASGATMNLYSGNDYAQPPADQIARKLVDMAPETFRPLNAVEKAFAQVIQTFNESFMDVRYEKFKAKPVTNAISEGVKKTSAAGGGLAGVRSDIEAEIMFLKDTKTQAFQTDENGNLKTTRARDRILTESWAGMKPVDEAKLAKMSEQQKTELALDRVEALYFKTLNAYKGYLGDASLVTPNYETVSRFTVANIKAVLLSNSKDESDLHNLEKIILTPDVKNLIRGNVDVPPGTISPVLVNRVMKEDITNAISELGLKLSVEKESAVVSTLLEAGKNINSKFLPSKDLKDAKEWVEDVKERLEECKGDEVRTKHFEGRKKLAIAARKDAEQSVDKDSISYDDYINIKKANPKATFVEELKSNEVIKSLGIEDAGLAKLLSAAVQNKANPSDLLVSRQEIADKVIAALEKEGVKVPDKYKKEAAMYIKADPGVGLDKDGKVQEGAHGGVVSKLKPITFLKFNAQAHKFLKDTCDRYIQKSPRENINKEAFMDRVHEDKHLVAFVTTALRNGVSTAEIHNQAMGTIQKYANHCSKKVENKYTLSTSGGGSLGAGL